jgi:hypothetical protein
LLVLRWCALDGSCGVELSGHVPVSSQFNFLSVHL